MSTARNEAYGDFGLADPPHGLSRDVAAALTTTVAVALGFAELITQWLAHALQYQAALGSPLVIAGATPLYAPWASLAWCAALRTTTDSGERLARQATGALILAAACAALAGFGVLSARFRARKNRAALLHGSARWARRAEIERTGLLSKRGVFLGRWLDEKSKTLRYLRHHGPQHVFAYAPTRAGKGVGLVIPTLLTWPGSAFVLDPKAENFHKTSGRRAAMGQRVYKLDVGSEDTARYNPLASVRLGEAEEVVDAQNIADCFTDPSSKAGGEGAAQHFALAAKGLLTAAILHVLYRERARGRVASLLDVMNELSDPERSEVQVMRDWLTFQHDPQLTERWRHPTTDAPTATHPVVAMYARQQLNREQKERASVLSTVTAAFEPFADPLLARNVSSSDFRLEDFVEGETPMTLYFVLSPRDEKRLRMFARLFLELMLRRLTEKHPPFLSAERPHRPPRGSARAFAQSLTRRSPQPQRAAPSAAAARAHRLLLMLDEFPTLGRLDIVSASMAIMAGYGIKAYLIAQNYKQVTAAYGAHESITANCHITVAFPTNDPDTAKRLSDLTGRATVIQRQRPQPSWFAPPRGLPNETEAEVSRPLLTPDECMRLPGPVTEGERVVAGGDILIFCAGSRPIYGKQALFFQDPRLLQWSKLPEAPARPTRLAATNAPNTSPEAATLAGAAAMLSHAPSVLAGVADEDEDEDELFIDPELAAIGRGPEPSDGDGDAGDDDPVWDEDEGGVDPLDEEPAA